MPRWRIYKREPRLSRSTRNRVSSYYFNLVNRKDRLSSENDDNGNNQNTDDWVLANNGTVNAVWDDTAAWDDSKLWQES